MIFVISIPVGIEKKVEVGRLVLFVAAATVSAATIGVTISWIGAAVFELTPTLRSHAFIGLACLSFAYGFAELRSAEWWVPTRTWIIPKRWALYGKVPFTLAFGSILGAGFFTIITFIGYHVLLISCFLIADWKTGAWLMSVFGLTRALPVLVTPIIYSRFATYDLNAAVRANQRFSQVNRHLSLLRWVTLFAIAGSSMTHLSRLK